MNVNTHVDILSFGINFVTLPHKCIQIGLWTTISNKDIKPIACTHVFYKISSVGERHAARYKTTHPDKHNCNTNINKVTATLNNIYG